MRGRWSSPSSTGRTSTNRWSRYSTTCQAVRDRRPESRRDRCHGCPPAGTRAGRRPLPRRDKLTGSCRCTALGVGSTARLSGGGSHAPRSTGGAAPAPRRSEPVAGPRRPHPGDGRRSRRRHLGLSSSSRLTRVDERPGLRWSHRSLHRPRGGRRPHLPDGAAYRDPPAGPADPRSWSCQMHRTSWRCPIRTRFRRGDFRLAAAGRRMTGQPPRRWSRPPGGGRELREHAHEHLRDVVDDEPAAGVRMRAASSELPASSARQHPTSAACSWMVATESDTGGSPDPVEAERSAVPIRYPSIPAVPGSPTRCSPPAGTPASR